MKQLPLLSNENLYTREVWEQNLDEELSIIREIVNDYPFVAMDTEFPGVVRYLYHAYSRFSVSWRVGNTIRRRTNC